MDNNTIKYYKTIGLINSEISKANSLDDALKRGLNIILKNTDSNYAIIWYFDNEDNRIHPYYWISQKDFTSLYFEKNEDIVGKVIGENSAITSNDLSKDGYLKSKEMFKDLNISSITCVPFSINNQLGCVEFLKSDSFNEEESEVCQILTILTELALKENETAFSSWKDRKVIMSVRDINKEFKNGELVTKVLKGINFDVFEGEFLCFLGESGCGKSTILNIIGGLDKATSGTFTFMGKDYSNASEDELTKYRRENIGFIFQNYNLMPNLNAKQNLDLIGELVDEKMDSRDALKLVGLLDKENNYPSELSGGQQQRISIARALIKKPKVIMADEPTAALDYQTSIEVLSALSDAIKSGTTLVMVTHNEEITKMANRVIRFRDGKVYEVTINSNPKKATDLVW